MSQAAGIGWAVIAVGLFAVIYASGKFTGGLASALQILFLRYVGGLVTVVGLILARRVPARNLRSRQPHVHMVRAACGGFGGVCAIYAATHMPIMDATAIGLLDGLLIVLFGALLLKETVTVRHWTAALVCAMGAAVVVIGKGAFNGPDGTYPLPTLVAFLGAVLIASEGILIKTLSRAEPTLTVLLYVNVFGIIVLMIPALLAWRDIGPSSILLFTALGPIAIVAQYCNIAAYRIADAAVLGPVRYTWIIFSSVMGLFLFEERMMPSTVLGCVLIMAGGVWLASMKPKPSVPVPGRP